MRFLRQLFPKDDHQVEPKGASESRLDRRSQTSREAAAVARPSRHDLETGFASDPGRVREHNEDAGLVWQFSLLQQGEPPPPVGLFGIADGMGGHARGERASALAIRVSAHHIIRAIALPLLIEDEEMAERAPIHEVLAASVRIAHQAVVHRVPEAGTTLTLALLLDENVYIAHVGDSRAYLGERGNLRPLTQDHSMAARLLRMEQATPQEVASQRNILYKAIGQGSDVEPDLVSCDLGWGQYLLLCCDGLWGKVSDEQISTIVEASTTPDIACQNLVAEANRNGGEDNISVILVARGWPLPTGEPSGQDEPGVRERRSDHGI
jgi:serine/threonine protein phosphatase PrpC